MRRLQAFLLAVTIISCSSALAQADSTTAVSILHEWVAVPAPGSSHRTVTLEVSIENDGSADMNYAAPVMLSGSGKTYLTMSNFGGVVLGRHAEYIMKLVFKVDHPGHYRLRVHNATADSDQYENVMVR